MSVKRETIRYGIAAVITAAVIIAASTLFVGTSLLSGQSQGSGTLSIYLTDAPPSSPTLKYLLVNVTSVELVYEGSSTITSTSTNSLGTSTSSTTVSSSTDGSTYVFYVSSSVGTNINLTSLHGKSLLLGATNIPSGQITSIVLGVSGAKAIYTDGTSEQLKVVADGKLMVPITFAVYSNGSTSLTIDITPNLIHISHAGVLRPVIHVTTVEEGPNNETQTHSALVNDSAS